MKKKIIIAILSFALIVTMMPLSVFAGTFNDDTYKPNLTIGKETISSDSPNWKKVKGNTYCYTGNNFKYYVDDPFNTPRNETLVLNGGTIKGYFQYQYDDAKLGTVDCETQAPISVNNILLDEYQDLEELNIKVEKNTNISITQHTPEYRTSIWEETEDNDIYTCGIYAYDGVNAKKIKADINIYGEGLLNIFAEEEIVSRYLYGINAQNINLGNDTNAGHVKMNKINVRGKTTTEPGGKNVISIGCFPHYSLELNELSSLEINDWNAYSEGFAMMSGIDMKGSLSVASGAKINISNLGLTSKDGSLAESTTYGIGIGGDVYNEGEINIGVDGAISINFNQESAGEFECAKCESAGIISNGALDNYGTLNVENIQTNFVFDGNGDTDNGTKAITTGIFFEDGIVSYPNSTIKINQKDGMQLDVDAQNAMNESFFTYAIETPTLDVEDAVVMAKCARSNVKADDDSSKVNMLGMFIGGGTGSDINLSGASKLKSEGNFFKAEGVSEGRHMDQGLYADNIVINDESYLFADAHLESGSDGGSGIVSSNISINDKGVLESYCANLPAIKIGSDIQLGEGYSPKVYYGTNPEKTTKAYSLKDDDGNYLYENNKYIKITPYLGKGEAVLNVKVGNNEQKLTKKGDIGETTVFSSKEIKNVANKLLPKGYVFKNAQFQDVTVEYGKTQNIKFEITKKPISKVYTVKFVVDGKVYQTQEVKEGHYAQKPSNPTKKGYKFNGWFLSKAAAGSSFDFKNTPITKNITLYADWIKKTDPKPNPDPNPNPPVNPEKHSPNNGGINTGDNSLATVFAGLGIVALTTMIITFKKTKNKSK